MKKLAAIAIALALVSGPARASGASVDFGPLMLLLWPLVLIDAITSPRAEPVNDDAPPNDSGDAPPRERTATPQANAAQADWPPPKQEPSD